MKLELLYFDGCPNYRRLLPRLRELGAAAGAEVQLRRVASVEAAERACFLGSPTVRVDGVDVRSEEGASGIPPEEWIRGALRT
jgi:hypothetical protein